MAKYVNISIPKPLYDRLAKALEGSGYRSPTEYLIFLIRKYLPELEAPDTDKRLQALGYK
jgi:metal-responsive CopG/Arc/MetJ family transcriptional regulator